MYGYPVRKLQTGPSRPVRALRVVSFPPSRRTSRLVTAGTKLSPPLLREDWIGRDALIQRLTWSMARVVLLEAPAGYGKTTLAAQWRASMTGRRRFAWLSLDPGDNDPRRLWPQIVLAVQRACPDLQAEPILQELTGHKPDIAGAVLPGLINELSALTRPITLVLDGYQVIRNPRCHEQIDALLLHLPVPVQVALLSRHDPPLALARLRAAGELTELRARDLRFTAAETAELLSAVSGPGLSPPDLSLLAERTEGWPGRGLPGRAGPARPARARGPPARRGHQVHRRLPGPGSPRRPAAPDPAVPRPYLGPGPVLRAAVRRPPGLGGLGRDPGHPGTGEPVHHPARRIRALVPVPHPVR